MFIKLYYYFFFYLFSLFYHLIQFLSKNFEHFPKVKYYV